MTRASVPVVRFVGSFGTALFTRDTFIYAGHLSGIDNTLAVAWFGFSGDRFRELSSEMVLRWDCSTEDNQLIVRLLGTPILRLCRSGSLA